MDRSRAWLVVALMFVWAATACSAVSARQKGFVVSLNLVPQPVPKPSDSFLEEPPSPYRELSDDPFVNIKGEPDSNVVRPGTAVRQMDITIRTMPNRSATVRVYRLPRTMVKDFGVVHPRRDGSMVLTWTMRDTLGKYIGRGVYQITAFAGSTAVSTFAVIE